MIRKVLFVIEKYCDGRAQLGLSYGSAMLKDTLNSSGLVQELDQFFFDERVIHAGRAAMEEDLLQKCRRMKPDLIVYTPNRDEISPRRSTLRKLTRELKLRTAVHLGDVAHNPWLIEKWLGYVSYVVILGGDQIHDLFYKNHSRVVNSFSAASPYIFRDCRVPRDIDVSFLGSRAVHPNRVEYIDHLIKNGIRVVSSGGQRENPMTLEDYAKTLNRSKLTVNFCLNGYNNIQVKGRLWEAMNCGAVVLEERNEFTPRYFTDNRDIVMFDTKSELLFKVKELLYNDKFRERIARVGHWSAASRFSGKRKWAEIISHIETTEAAGGEAGLGHKITRALENVSRKCRVIYYCLAQPTAPHPWFGK